MLRVNLHIQLAALILSMASSALLKGQAELILPSRHSGKVLSIRIAPTEQWAATLGQDDTIQIWALPGGAHLRTIRAPGAREIALDPLGKTIAAVHSDGKVRLWDVKTGRMIDDGESQQLLATSVAWSPDGNTLAVASTLRNSIFLIPPNHLSIDPSSVPRLPYEDGAWGALTNLTFTEPGNQIIGTSAQGELLIWDTKSNSSPVRVWPNTKPDQFALALSSVAVAPGFIALAAPDQNLYVWKTGHLDTAGPPIRLEIQIPAVAFSPDGSRVYVSGLGRQVSAREATTGNVQVTYGPERGLATSVSTLAATKSLVLAGCANGELLIWRMSDGKLSQNLLTPQVQVTAAAFPSRGNILLAGSQNGNAVSWRIDSKVTKLNLFSAANLSQLPDTFAAAYRSDAGPGPVSYPAQRAAAMGPGLASMETTNPKCQLCSTSAMTISPNGNYVAWALEGPGAVQNSRLARIIVWDVLHERTLFRGHDQAQTATAISFSPDGTTVAAGYFDGTIQLWSLPGGVEQQPLGAVQIERSISQIVIGDTWIKALQFSPDGKTLVAGRGDGILEVVDMANKTARTLDGGRTGITAIAFAPSGKILASGGSDGSLRLWDITSGASWIRDPGAATTSFIAFRDDGAAMLDVSSQGTIHFSKVKDLSLTPTLTLQLFGEVVSSISPSEVPQRWLAIAPNGMFDGSEKEWPELSVRLSPDTFNVATVDSLFRDFYHPGLLTEILEDSKASTPISSSTSQSHTPLLSQIQPSALRLSLSLSGPKREGIVTLTIKVTGAKPGAGIREIRLLRNDLMVKHWRDLRLNAAESVIAADVHLTSGVNRLVAYAIDQNKLKSEDSDPLIVKDDRLTKGTSVLYVLAIGIDEYADSQFRLNYAKADAEYFERVLSVQRDGIRDFASFESAHLNTRGTEASEFEKERLAEVEEASGPFVPTHIYNEYATKAGILNALRELTRQAKPDDSVLIFYAGHGITRNGRFYFLPHDFKFTGPPAALPIADISQIAPSAISDVELEAVLENLDVAHAALIVDACDSGQLVESSTDRRLGPVDATGLAQLAFEKGISLLAASQKYEAAREDTHTGHGRLTFTLVEEGLRRAQANTTGAGGIAPSNIYLNDLLAYAAKTLPRVYSQNPSLQTHYVESNHPLLLALGPVDLDPLSGQVPIKASRNAVVKRFSKVLDWSNTHPPSEDPTAVRLLSPALDGSGLSVSAVNQTSLLSFRFGAEVEPTTVTTAWTGVFFQRGTFVSEVNKGGLTFWKVPALTQLAYINGIDNIQNATVSADGKLIAWAVGRPSNQGFTIIVRNSVSAVQLIRTEFDSGQVGEIEFNSDNSAIGVLSDNIVSVLPLEPGKGPALRINGTADSDPLDVTSGFDFSPEGKLIVTGTSSGRVRVWDGNTGSKVRSFITNGSVITVAFSPDFRTVAAACADNSIWTWDTATDTPPSRYEILTSPPRAMGFSSKGRLLVAATKQGSLVVVDLLKREPVLKLTLDPETQVWIAQSNDGKFDAPSSLWPKLTWTSTDGTRLPSQDDFQTGLATKVIAGFDEQY